MNKIQHLSNNAVLGAPQGWDQSEVKCSALAITRATMDGLPVVGSYWQPTPEELVALNAGKPIVLWVVGATMPPVLLEVSDE